MKRSFLIFIILLCMFIVPVDVYAHPGGLNSNGCHYCRTNCAKWGLNQDEYHCHSGNTYTNSKGQTFNKDGVKISDPVTNNPEPELEPTPEPEPSVSNDVPNNNSNNNASSNTNSNTKPSTNSGNNSSLNNNTSTSTNKPSTNTSVEKEEKLSNDASIKSLKVNGKDVDVSDNMFSETSKKTLILKVNTNSKKAKVSYEQKELVMGENEIIIKVTAEDGTEKEYKLIVKRIEGQGTATFIELSIGTYDIEFDNYKASILLTKGETLDGISYKLSVENAIVKLYLNDKEVDDIKNLKGDNILTLVTIDGDNNKLTYEVEINEMGLIGTILFYILIIVILVWPIVVCVFVFKFIKKKIKK